MAYSKTNWQNEPSHATPLSADNLNKIENELYNQSVNLVVDNSVSLGRKSATTVGTNSSALGSNCTASGNDSHAEGYSTTASGDGSHAEGYVATASGTNAHAEGLYSIASGQASHAEGVDTRANGKYSHAQNNGTIANGDNQTVLGAYNIADTTSLVIVGNGLSSARSNALTVDGSGNVTIAGSLTDGNGNTPNEVEWTQHQLSGTKIATVSIDGNSTDVYAPTGGGGGGASSLSQLDDVSISTPTNNQVLKYNSTTQKWENGTGGGGGTSDYEDLTNQPQINGVTLIGDKDTEDLKIEKVLTQAEYDALPDTKLTDGVNYFVSDAESTTKYHEDFSAVETVVGSWNGKPLYRKCFSADNVSITTTTVLDASLTPSNVTPTRIDSTYKFGDAWYDGTFYFTSDTGYTAYTRLDSAGARMVVTNRTVQGYRVAIYYTKNAD